MEDSKNATIRLSQDITNWLTRDGKSVNQAIVDAVRTLQTIRRVSTLELKGIFTPEEWRFMADTFNGITVSEPMRFNVEMFITECEDKMVYNNLFQVYEFNLQEFKDKLRRLGGVHIDAILARIDLFRNSEADGMDVWADF